VRRVPRRLEIDVEARGAPSSSSFDVPKWMFRIVESGNALFVHAHSESELEGVTNGRAIAGRLCLLSVTHR